VATGYRGPVNTETNPAELLAPNAPTITVVPADDTATEDPKTSLAVPAGSAIVFRLVQVLPEPVKISCSYPGAAAVLREELGETLTLTRLGITGSLTRTLASTSPVESMIECVSEPPATSSAGPRARRP
jgi:hypothetical protein